MKESGGEDAAGTLAQPAEDQAGEKGRQRIQGAENDIVAQGEQNGGNEPAGAERSAKETNSFREDLIQARLHVTSVKNLFRKGDAQQMINQKHQPAAGEAETCRRADMKPPVLIKAIDDNKRRQGQQRDNHGSLQAQRPVIKGDTPLLRLGSGVI